MGDELSKLLLWLLLLGGGVFVIFVVMVELKIWNPWQRKVGIEEISGILHFAFFRHQNGGTVKFQHRGSDAWFSFERVEGEDDSNSALAALRIPRVTWKRAKSADLNEVFGKHGFEVDTDAANESLIGRVLIPIDDIWDEASGASAAYAARVLMEATDIGLDQKFAVKDIGVPSRRYAENAWKFR